MLDLLRFILNLTLAGTLVLFCIVVVAAICGLFFGVLLSVVDYITEGKE